MSQPKPHYRRSTHMITRRTSQRLMRLLPRGKKLKQLLRYAIFSAAATHGVQIHGFCCMSTHIHVICTDIFGSAPDFARDMFRLIAKAANSLHGTTGELWDGRGPHYLRLEGASTVYRYMVYAITNPVGAVLVRSCTDWPGAITTPGQTARSGTAVRPKMAFFRRSSLPTSIAYQLTIPPQLAHLSPDAFRQELARRVAAREATLRAKVLRRGGRFLGVRALLRLDRFSAPPDNGEVLGARIPHVADDDPDRRVHRIKALQAFRLAYAKARELWLQGLGEVLFPAGTFKMRGYPNVKVADQTVP